jgi:hypothetical protein
LGGWVFEQFFICVKKISRIAFSNQKYLVGESLQNLCQGTALKDLRQKKGDEANLKKSVEDKWCKDWIKYIG